MSVPTTWIDGTSGGRYAEVFEERVRGGLVFPEDFGALGGNTLIDELPQLQEAVDSVIGTGKNLVLSNPPYWTKGTVLVGANMGFHGTTMNWPSIARLPGSGTGPAIREKTTAEGNPSGGTGLWITNMTIRGMYPADPGSGGNYDAGSHGLHLGDQVPGAQLNYNSGIFNIMTRGFHGSGAGIYLNQNAATCGWLTASDCTIGGEFHGGGNTYLSTQWGPGNLLQDVIMAGSVDIYSGVQTEFGVRPTGLVESVKVTGAGTTINGMGIAYAGGDIGNAVLLATGSGQNTIFGYFLKNNDSPTPRAFTNAIFTQATSFGTGSVQTYFPVFAQAASASPSWYYDQNLGVVTKVSAGGVTPQAARNLTYSASMTPDASLGEYLRITITNGSAMAINAPTNPSSGDVLTFEIVNSSGGAHGVITWNSAYRIAGGATGFPGGVTPAIATGKRRTITVLSDGTNWVERGRVDEDI